MYDAVHLFAKAFDEVSRAQVISTTPLSCNKRKGWIHGNSLLNYMKMVNITTLGNSLIIHEDDKHAQGPSYSMFNYIYV